MDIAFQAGQLILSLSILIVIHEFGHYLPARAFKTRVEKFYLFFDYKFSIFKKKIKNTEWGIGWIPLGGYVKISGMIDESMDTQQMEKDPEPWEFRSKPAWQRLIIMIGGIVVNLIVGFIIYAMVLAVWGQVHIKPEDVKYGMSVAPEFKHYGFEDGDELISLDGEKIQDVSTVSRDVMLRGARDVEVKHPNGEIEVITLNEDANFEMFESGAFQLFTPRTLALVDTVLPERPAMAAGFEKEDVITSVDDKPVKYWDEFVMGLYENKGKTIAITVDRDGKSQDIQLEVDSLGKVGIGPSNREISEMISHEEFSFGAAIPAGFSIAFWKLHDYGSQLKFLFTKKGASSMGGFGTFGKMFHTEWHWQSFWTNTALISIILAFMNFLPIPALDGGHIMFLLYEMISGRKPHQNVMDYAQIIGIILILGLVVFANGNDIYKAITGR